MAEKTIKVWFRAKYFGYGWYPGTWQAWLLLGIFLASIMINAFILDAATLTNTQYILSLIQNVLLVIPLLVLCYVTGEKAEWRWGKNNRIIR